MCEALEKRELLAGDVVISEFLAVNESNLKDNDGQFSDWIEVSNKGDTEIDLDGWYLTDNDSNLTKWKFPSVSIPRAGSIIVYASNEDRSDPAVPLHTNFRLSSNGEFLALVEPDGETVASAFTPTYPPQSADVSYGLSEDGQRAGYFRTPTPGARNADPEADPARQIIITEIMYHPPSEDSAEEFVELYNAGSQPVDLSGWRITGGIEFSFDDFTIPAGGYAVVAADATKFTAIYGDAMMIAAPWSGQLSNSSDRITLRDQNNLRVDKVTYADGGDWAIRERVRENGADGWIWADDHDGGGKSLELQNRMLQNEHGQNWSASHVELGTPGAQNSVDTSISAPFVLDVQHIPAIPHSDQSVLVTASIVAPTVPASVKLTTTVDGATAELAMRDDGQNGDAFANDGLYSALIPPFADMTVVEFSVSATGANNSTREWPAPVRSDGGEDTNALYQVIDAFVAPEPGEFVVPTYYQVMTPADRAAFATDNRRSDAQKHATFISVDNEGTKIRYNTGVRIRGSGSRNANPPNNRINFPSDDPWNDVTSINLNVDTIQDQIAGSALFRAFGLPAGEAKAVRMFSNGVNLRAGQGGFYAHVEPLNSEFAANQFPEDSNGNLYKGRRSNESPPGGRGAGLAYHGPDPGPYVSYLKQTNAGEADYSDVINLTDVLNNAPDETFLADVSRVVDIEQWINFFALNALISNTEGGLATGDRQGDDYAMYRGIDDPASK